MSVLNENRGLPQRQKIVSWTDLSTCPGRGAAFFRRCEASSGHAAPKSRDPSPVHLSWARRKKTRVNALMALRSVRGTPWCTRNDDKTHVRSLAAQCARVMPEFVALRKRGRGECRAPDAPAASCALGVVSMHTSIHSEFTGNHPAFPHAMVLTAYSALSPATNSSCHRRRRINGISAPGRADTPPPT
jgi:hypothetical protein